MAITFNRLGELGRLGNQLFQIASTIGIAKKNEVDFNFPEWKYQKYFKNKLPNDIINGYSIKEKRFEFDDYFVNPNINYDLHGYFQSEKYWINCKEEIFEYFEFDDYFKNLVCEKNPKLLPFNQTAIHVRRGDYLRLSDYHTNLSMNYYNDAISMFPDKTFIVFSDDIAWCKEKFKGNKYYFSQGTDIEDLYLMSICEGHIIANSSFSWWGAYLSKSKKVIAPNKWFGEKMSNVSTSDLIPKNWIRI